MLADELLFVDGGCPLCNGWSLAGVIWADEEDLADKRVLRCRQDGPKVYVMSPFTGNLDWR